MRSRDSTSPLLRVGLLGGSFDPLHIGHLVMADQAMAQLGLEKTILIPSARPPHKVARRLAAAELRLEMVKTALPLDPRLEVDSLELERSPRPSFTVETLQHFAREYKGTAELFFIMGMDSFLEISTWKDHHLFLEYSHLIVATRPGYDETRIQRDVPTHFLERLQKPGNTPSQGHGVWLIEIPALPISATQLRETIRAGGSIRYLVPDPVRLYIEKQNLYR